MHDSTGQQAKDGEIRAKLKTNGFRVVVVRYDKDIGEQVADYPDVSRKAKE